MGNAGAKLIGMEKAAVPVNESVGGILKTVCSRLKHKYSQWGHYLSVYRFC